MITQTETILKYLHIISWIVFVGLLIKAGAILLSFFLSFENPEAANDLYLGLDLSDLKSNNIYHFSSLLVVMIFIIILQAYISYLVIKILSKINLKNPFEFQIANLMQRISYMILLIWIVTVISNAYTDWLEDNKLTIGINSDSLNFIFLAGIIFVFAQIFKRGVEIQSEQELTV